MTTSLIDCLEQHARDHTSHGTEPNPNAWAYIFCSCAHQLEAALAVASGRLLSIVDAMVDDAKPLWSECEPSSHLRPNASEFYAVRHHVYHHAVFGPTERHAVGLTHGACHADLGRDELQSQRQAYFPVELLKRAVQCAPEHASAAWLHAAFVAAGWRLLLERACDGHELLDAAAALIAQSSVRKLALCLWNCERCTDETLCWAASALPHTLEELRLDLTDSAATSAGGNAVLKAVALKLMRPASCNLRRLELGDCMLTGSIPAELGGCQAMLVLILQGNELTGAIPPELGRCVALQRLNLSENRLSGALPEALGRLALLKKLNLRDNRLSGKIPEALGRLTDLTKLELSWNCLVKQALPEELCKRAAAGKLKVRLDWLRTN